MRKTKYIIAVGLAAAFAGIACAAPATAVLPESQTTTALTTGDDDPQTEGTGAPGAEASGGRPPKKRGGDCDGGSKPATDTNTDTPADTPPADDTLR